MSEKIEAINTTLGTGLAEIKVANKTIGETLDLRLKAIDEKLTGTNSNLSNIKSELSSLNQAIDKMNTNITEGFTTVRNQINTAIGEAKSALENKIQALQDKTDENSQAQLKKLQELLDQLKKMAADNGIYQNPDDNSSIYMTPQMWAAVSANSDLTSTISNMLTMAKAPSLLYDVYYNASTGMVKDNATSLQTATSSVSSVKLVAGTLQSMDLANGKQVIRVTKVPSEVTYTFTASNTTRPIIAVYWIDAVGTQNAGWATGKTTASIKASAYNNGTIASVVKCNVYLKGNATAGTPTFVYPK